MDCDPCPTPSVRFQFLESCAKVRAPPGAIMDKAMLSTVHSCLLHQLGMSGHLSDKESALGYRHVYAVMVYARTCAHTTAVRLLTQDMNHKPFQDTRVNVLLGFPGTLMYPASLIPPALDCAVHTAPLSLTATWDTRVRRCLSTSSG